MFPIVCSISVDRMMVKHLGSSSVWSLFVMSSIPIVAAHHQRRVRPQFIFGYPNPNEKTKLCEINCLSSSIFLLPHLAKKNCHSSSVFLLPLMFAFSLSRTYAPSPCSALSFSHLRPVAVLCALFRALAPRRRSLRSLSRTSSAHQDTRTPGRANARSRCILAR